MEHRIPTCLFVDLQAYKSQVKYPISTTSLSGLELCFDTAGVTSPSFPMMEIHLNGAQLSLLTENTFVIIKGDKDMSCLAMIPNSYPGALEVSILGNIQQQDFDIVYDFEDMVIRFSPVDCARL